MKLPSLRSLWKATSTVFTRFPLPFLLAILATIAALLLVEVEYDYRTLSHRLSKFLALCNIGFVLLLAADLYAENALPSLKKRVVVSLIVILLCALLFFLLSPAYYKVHLYQLILFSIGGHLLVAITPFLMRKGVSDFWTFNKTLFLRFITATLYSLILFIGLVIALYAIDKLFSVKLDDKYYQRLFVTIAIGFNTLFFLAGVPHQAVRSSEKSSAYPKGLKVFTQYVLIPLMSVYLLILLIYEVKIIVDWELPNGMVSTLIIGYAFFGILSLLLVFPIRNTVGNTWIKLFTRFFYFTMVPLLVLLLLAVYKRVTTYGITEPRYFLMAIALWLSCITVYFLVSKKQDIRLIPSSLCLIVFASIYGPQSASNVSLQSQKKRLKALMEEEINENNRAKKTSTVQYLVKTHGLSSFQSFTDKDLSTIEKNIETKNEQVSTYVIVENKLDAAYALLDIDPSTIHSSYKRYTVFSDEEQAVAVKGWDFLIRLDNYQQEVTTTLMGNAIRIIPDNKQHTCTVIIGADQHIFDLNRLLRDIEEAYTTNKLTAKTPNDLQFYYPKEKMQLNTKLKGYDVCLSLRSIYIDRYRSKDDDATGYYTNFSANILLKAALAK